MAVEALPANADNYPLPISATREQTRGGRHTSKEALPRAALPAGDPTSPRHDRLSPSSFHPIFGQSAIARRSFWDDQEPTRENESKNLSLSGTKTQNRLYRQWTAKLSKWLLSHGTSVS